MNCKKKQKFLPIDVIGSVWWLNVAIGLGFVDLIKRKSQHFIAPSSPPDSKNFESNLFHDITLTSLLCVLLILIDELVFLKSHILIDLSTEQDANIFSSVGDHCIS